MTTYESKKISRGTQKALRGRVSALRKEGWEKVGAKCSVIQSGPGYRRAIYQQQMRRPVAEVVE